VGILRIAYICDWDANDMNKMSGAAYYMRRALIENEHIVFDIFPINRHPAARAWRFLTKGVAKAFALRGRYYSGEREPAYRWLSAAIVNAALKKIGPVDAVFSQSSVPVTDLKTAAPIYTAADQSFMANLRDYIRHPSDRYLNTGKRQMTALAGNISKMFVPSEWAAREMRTLDGFPGQKIVVAPWGANLPTEPSDGEVKGFVDERVAALKGGEIRFVFIGKDWARKGGDIVCQTLDRLQKQGLRVHLDIMGVEPGAPIGFPHDRLGFINKSVPADFARFQSIMRRAHFLFVPSRAEAYGHMFCEAMAFGVPAVAADVGGVSAIIKNASNGICLPLAAGAADYAEAIAGIASDAGQYRTMAATARHDYTKTLSWRRFADALTAQINMDRAA
jgi:glycosyltransferase involved in cell wall biosynthesis